ncbi:MAG: nucleotidyltransferase family protein [Pseudomonadota bacterium]
MFDQLCGLLRAGLRHTPSKLADDLPWEQLVEASSFHHATPFLAWTLRDHRGLDPEVQAYLSAILTLNTQRDQQLMMVIERVALALNAIDIAPVLFKGAAYLADRLYPAPGLRITGDIDLLLPGGRAPDIARALKQAGLEAEAALVLVRKQLPYLPHFRDPVTGATLDIHTEVAPQQWWSVAEPAGFEASCRPVALGSAQVRIPCPTDLIAHSIVHNQLKDRYYQRHAVQLRQLLDLDFLCGRHQGGIDWPELESRFEKAGNAPVLSTNFHLVEALFHRDTPGFKCPPRPLALELLRASVEHPGYQRKSLMAGWASQYAAQLKSQPLSILNLLNVRTHLPRLRRLHGILWGKRW